ncbi:carbohydrate ABC transporter substrate-binding protein, CUT1 family [Pelagirhabdus alkalitolerans]|uniref:Carbohydrate ABC transporter substrate-binding protein, CUT1 family n=1 Tax=Pelagirhabdus alkalitolerans TaxID=1612202 RepID=A0A1G6LFV3_9BACI|nr:extracellular solute-binding protein [Pelagirhabdus alkalitolerans]SDC42158.1 carbohydrate ABC transporter substrate-binding protein, CUT1 family [Pelagirhabdus alkalitolerans]
MGKYLKSIMLLLSLALLMALAACGNGETEDVEGDTDEEEADEEELSGDITFWTASLSGDPFDGYFDELKEEFEDMHPEVSVTIQDTPQNEMEQRVLTSLTSDDAPDVVNLNPHYMSNIASQGGLLPIGDYVSDDYQETYVEGALESGYYDGELHALPWYLTTTVSWYNQEHFESAGIEEVPTSMPEIHETATAISEETGNTSFFQIINDGNVIMEKMSTLAGDDYIVEDGTAVFNENEKIVEYFTTMQEMYDEGLISQENAEGGIGTAQELFMSEDISFLEGGITFLGAVESGAPSVYENSVAGDPLNDPDSPVNIAVMNLAVPANTDHPEAAVAFAEFVLNAENQLEFSKTAGTVLPSTVESLEDEFYTDPGDSPNATGMKAGAEALSTAEVLIPGTDNNSELRNLTHDAFVDTLIGNVDPQEALDQLAEDWNQSFSSEGIEISF